MDWLEWKIPYNQRQNHVVKIKNKTLTAAESVDNHPRLAGLIGILPHLRYRTKHHNDFILNIKEHTKNKIRSEIMKTITIIISIRCQHRKQKWPPDSPDHE